MSEREEIVAWLRGLHQWAISVRLRSVYGDLADRIERKEHAGYRKRTREQ
jgi:hypothetical protein